MIFMNPAKRREYQRAKRGFIGYVFVVAAVIIFVVGLVERLGGGDNDPYYAELAERGVTTAAYVYTRSLDCCRLVVNFLAYTESGTPKSITSSSWVRKEAYQRWQDGAEVTVRFHPHRPEIFLLEGEALPPSGTLSWLGLVLALFAGGIIMMRVNFGALEPPETPRSD